MTSLREHQLLAKGSTCEFMRREAEFLGFMVSGEGVRPLPSKIEAVVQIPVPETISHLRSFLGMCNFFRAHIPAYAEISAPLTDLLKGSKHGRQRLAWNLGSDHAFAHLKELLTTAPSCVISIRNCVQQYISMPVNTQSVQSYYSGRRARRTLGQFVSCLASCRCPAEL